MRRRPWPGNARVMAVLSSLLLGGCVGPGGEGDEGARTAATEFLDEVRAGRLEAAWQGTSAEFKSLMGLENLRDFVRAHPVLGEPAEYAETRALDRGGLDLAECVFLAPAFPKGAAGGSTITVLVAEGDEGWAVERLTVD
ncbi:hypothetical protein [Tautonia sociabilis]|uniref:Uncharacterized protein n=1 Tax=Tautonia sociabilis TaxID=2080755 RepID=A0A432MFQ2_9BACT|nr:hypothetical protein [Tautonia sociabilis]RUL84926.1 hypothetical protein TsocGM_19485 [Tautonia sociabilis]